ncbi:unnamed protein product [Heterotrigona itama]|uniref:Uncharacterized protein n=1 Tax=Heterotrigona itama TaxID=395501 RepID=A0A6V7HIA7_9HYME|nr:unnamed protein product [Heterotrigona itama]
MQFRFLSGDDVATMAHLPGVVPPSTLLKTQPLVHTEVLLSGMFQEMKGSRGYQREREERQRPHPTMALSSKSSGNFPRGNLKNLEESSSTDSTGYTFSTCFSRKNVGALLTEGRSISSFNCDYETKKEGGSKFTLVHFASSSTR